MKCWLKYEAYEANEEKRMDLFDLLAMIGGLALFLYGMKLLSDGLEKLSGGSLERVLENLTSNRLGAVHSAGVVHDRKHQLRIGSSHHSRTEYRNLCHGADVQRRGVQECKTRICHPFAV